MPPGPWPRSKHLSGRLPVSQQAVRQGLLTAELPARFQVLPGRPTTILDVAHNPHAAAVLAENLDSMGFFPVTHAVFGMLRDKDIAGVVARLGSRIDHWHVGPTPGPRGTSAARSRTACAPAGVGMACRAVDHAARQHSADAYAAARETAAADDRILAFGSFLTVADAMRAIRTHVPVESLRIIDWSMDVPGFLASQEHHP